MYNTESYPCKCSQTGKENSTKDNRNKMTVPTARQHGKFRSKRHMRNQQTTHGYLFFLSPHHMGCGSFSSMTRDWTQGLKSERTVITAEPPGNSQQTTLWSKERFRLEWLTCSMISVTGQVQISRDQKQSTHTQNHWLENWGVMLSPDSG